MFSWAPVIQSPSVQRKRTSRATRPPGRTGPAECAPSPRRAPAPASSQHVRLDEARADRVDGDSGKRASSCADALGEGDDACFCRGVVRLPQRARLTDDAGDVDDSTPPRAIIGSSAALVQWKTLFRLTWMTSSHSAAVILRKVRSRFTPALLTRISTGPRSRAAMVSTRGSPRGGRDRPGRSGPSRRGARSPPPAMRPAAPRGSSERPPRHLGGQDPRDRASDAREDR